MYRLHIMPAFLVSVTRFAGYSICTPSRLLALSLQILVSNYAIDVLCVSETCLSALKPTKQVLLSGFQEPFRRDRLDAPGVGVAVYVRNGLPATPCALLDMPFPSLECLCVSLRLTAVQK